MTILLNFNRFQNKMCLKKLHAPDLTKKIQYCQSNVSIINAKRQCEVSQNDDEKLKKNRFSCSTINSII